MSKSVKNNDPETYEKKKPGEDMVKIIIIIISTIHRWHTIKHEQILKVKVTL